MVDSTNYDNTRIKLSETTLEYRMEGTNQPTVLLLHGLNAHSGSWRKNLPIIATKRRVVAPSFPPPRRTETPYETANIQTRLLAELVDKLGIDSLTLVGNSLGGLVGMLYAVDNSEVVCSIVLEDSAGVELKKLLERFCETRIPTLIIWGERDTVTPLERVQGLLHAIPRAELVTLKEAAHVPHWEVPDRFNEFLLAFLERTGC
jgi:pimeloyl-ACP methyl ester carboxylesterase